MAKNKKLLIFLLFTIHFSLFTFHISLFADKLDSLLHIHDTSTIVYYYHFTDNLSAGKTFTVDGSRLTGFQRYNPLDQEGRFYGSLGNVGLAHKSLVYTPKLSNAFYTGMESFDVYTFTNENTRYYRHLIPVTYLVYHNGSQKEQLFRVVHSHTIKRMITVGVDFSLINSPGMYQNLKSDDKSVVFTGQYFTKDLRFGVIANYRHNKILVRENGGITNDTIFEEEIETDSRLIDVNLTTAQNLVRESGIFANAYFYLSGKPEIKDSTDMRLPTFHAGRISYNMGYSWGSQVYSDQEPLSEFYQPFGTALDTNETYDSLSIKYFEHRFAWSNLRMEEMPEKKYLLVTFAISNRFATISDSISQRQINNWIPEASMVIRPYRSLAIFLEGKYTLGDFNDGGFALKGLAQQTYKVKNGTSGDAAFSFTTTSQQAGYFYTNFQSNYFRWDTNFSNQIMQEAAFALSYGTLKGRAEYHFISDYVYFDQTAHPRQYKGSINIIKLMLTDEFRWKVWGIDAQVVYQMNSNKDIIRIPALVARVSFIPTFSLFKNAAIFQPGVDLLYNTPYYANAWMPATRAFYLQDEKKIGNNVYIDIFANLMVKRFRIFAKYQHLNSLWGKKDYYMTPHYPMQEAIFKFGMSWSFYD
jgi:hypothetical protein